MIGIAPGELVGASKARKVVILGCTGIGAAYNGHSKAFKDIFADSKRSSPKRRTGRQREKF